MLKEFKTLIPLIKKYRYFYLAGILCLIIVDAGELYIPMAVKRIVDYISTESFSLTAVGSKVWIIIAIALTVAIARFGWRFFIHGASRRIESSLRGMLFDHLLTLSPSFFSKTKTGDIMARATNDMRAIRMATGMAIVAFMDGVFLTLAILIIIFSKYPRLAAVSVIPIPVITVLVLLTGRLVRRYFTSVQEGFSRLTEKVQETLSGIRVIKSFAAEDYFVQDFFKTNEEYKNRNMKLVRLWGFFFPLINFISGISIMLLFTFGGIAVITGSITPGDFVALISYLGMLSWPVMGMGFTVNMLQRGAASLARINELLRTETDIKQADNPVQKKPEGDISIRNLNFSYDSESGENSTVLHDINLDIPAGQTLGILGRTGSGKSTLIKIIPRLLDPPDKTVFWDNTDIREFSLSSLRSSAGMVPQDTFLFSLSILENIKFGSPQSPDSEALKAADMSTISEDLKEFPERWNTVVGERGVSLSGGQKQRIAISRALMLDTPLLIMDDAFSSVDTKTEERILKEFITIRQGRTNILVSHRVSTLMHADNIIVMDNGRIIQIGTHDSLYREDGLYREIAMLQESET